MALRAALWLLWGLSIPSAAWRPVALSRGDVLRVGLAGAVAQLLQWKQAAWAQAPPPAVTNEPGNVALSPQSVLLRTLPVRDRFFRKLQELLESVNDLRTCPGDKDTTEDSAVWNSVDANLGEAAQVLKRHRNNLSPAFRGNDTVAEQIRRAEGSEQDLANFRKGLNDLIVAVKDRNLDATLRAQDRTLLQLNYVGEWMVPDFPYSLPIDEELENLPQLRGRATVQVTLRRKASRRGRENPFAASTTNFTVVLDGYAAPLAAGNVLDLCVRNYYNGLGFNYTLAVPDGNSEGGVPVLLGGLYNPGFVDPITGKLRLLPLEVLRQSTDSSKRTIAVGAARNSALFTRDPPVASFVNAGAVGLYHPPDDANSGNAAFFAVRAPPDTIRQCRQVPLANAMDGRYSLFGWIVEREGVLSDVKPGDEIIGVQVIRGLPYLLRRAPTFTKILSSAGEEEE